MLRERGQPALTVTAAVLLVLSYVVKGVLAAVLGAAVGCPFAMLWLVLPLTRRWSTRDEQ